jgi:hypothetical protein
MPMQLNRRLACLAPRQARRYTLPMAVHGVHPEYIRRHWGPELTQAEFERALGLTETQRRLAQQIVADVRRAMARRARRKRRQRSRRAG